jgi:hypothetical protein
MGAVFSLLLLAGLAFLLHVLVDNRRHLPHVVNNLLTMGALFLPLGYLLGPERVALVSEEALRFFEPLFALVVGWIGLVLGLQLNIHDLRTFPRRFFVYAVVDVVATFTVAFGLFYLFANVMPGLPDLGLRSVAGFALLTTCVSPIPLFLFFKTHRIVTRRAQFVRFLVTFNNIIVIVVFATLRVALPGEGSSIAGLEDLAWLAAGAKALGLNLAVAGLAGVFFVLLGRARFDVAQGFSLILGMVLLVSGLASVIGASSLFSNLVVGAVLANVSTRRTELFGLLARYEKHLYVALLLLAGVSLPIEGAGRLDELKWLLVALFILPLARSAGGLAMRREIPMRMGGLAMIGRGGLAVALAMEFHAWLPAADAATALLIAGGSLVVTSAIGPALMEAIGLKERLERDQAERSAPRSGSSAPAGEGGRP